MNKTTAATLRGWTLGLSLVALIGGFLIANINVFNTSLVYLGLFLIVVMAGLLTNAWGGLIASGIAVFALVLLNQYVGIYPVQNRVVNIASELGIFLAAGPLAGWFSQIVERHQASIHHLAAIAERESMHDPIFNTLKPEWSKVRLEEEVARARAYSRPLSVGLLALTDIDRASRKEQAAALQALIRIARSSTTIPSVVSYLGENRVLLILPEHSNEQAKTILANIQARAEKELYFPADGEAPGQPLSRFGKLQMATASLGSASGSAESLLQNAADELSR